MGLGKGIMRTKLMTEQNSFVHLVSAALTLEITWGQI